LRLEDLDWTAEVITVQRPKQRRTQCYPLVASVGDAILRYLQAARPRCASREVFVTLNASYCPVSAGGMYYAAASRLNALGIQAEHHGPLCLRHACAAHLAVAGPSLREMGIISATAVPMQPGPTPRSIWPGCAKSRRSVWEGCHKRSEAAAGYIARKQSMGMRVRREARILGSFCHTSGEVTMQEVTASHAVGREMGGRNWAQTQC
jgi:hypothetical protein